MLERSEAVSALSWGNESHVKIYATSDQDRLPLREMLRIWSQRSQGRSIIKLGIYGFSCILLAVGILASQTWPSILFFQMLLGLAYAHGLELTHEALHHNMFERNIYNRIAGFLTGAPMLVSYTHYRFQHLHHHRFIGTDKDKELFDYDPKSLRNPITFALRTLNFWRVPRFFMTLFEMWRGRYPDVFTTDARRRDVLIEYSLIGGFFIVAVLVTVLGITDIFLLLWIIPWLVFGEAFHFIIELPEHLGCDKSKRDILLNTRTYRTNSIYYYIINGNNYHIEHHLYPYVAVQNLPSLSAYLEAEGQKPVPSTFAAFREVFQGQKHDGRG
jgi:fatty acid desaturase